MRYIIYKRLLDITISILALVVFSPILLVVFIMITLSGGSAIFKQTRIGLNNAPFTIYKFRTMVLRSPDDIDQYLEPIVKRRGDNRVTFIGGFLRATSIDELPQLFNVLKGDMSIVGPRPILPEQLTVVPPRFTIRGSLRPGITGQAQLNGRRSLSWFQQLYQDELYVHKLSFLNDLKIILKTLFVPFTAKNIDGENTVNWREYKDYLGDAHPSDDDIKKFL